MPNSLRVRKPRTLARLKQLEAFAYDRMRMSVTVASAALWRRRCETVNRELKQRRKGVGT